MTIARNMQCSRIHRMRKRMVSLDAGIKKLVMDLCSLSGWTGAVKKAITVLAMVPLCGSAFWATTILLWIRWNAKRQRVLFVPIIIPKGLKVLFVQPGCVFMAAHGASKKQILKYVKTFGYDKLQPLWMRRPFEHFDLTCQASIPLAIRCFLESNSWERVQFAMYTVCVVIPIQLVPLPVGLRMLSFTELDLMKKSYCVIIL